jgi:hypothetical protein
MIVTSRDTLFNRALRKAPELRSLVVRLKGRVRVKETSYSIEDRKELLRRYGELYTCVWLKNLSENSLPPDLERAAERIPTPAVIWLFCEKSKSADTPEERRHCLDEAMKEQTKAFANEIAQLEETDSDGCEPGRLCFKSGRIELRIRCASAPRIESIARRVTILVESLDSVVEQFEERSIPFTRLCGLLYTDRRLEVLDPAGNRIILKQMSFVGLL